MTDFDLICDIRSDRNPAAQQSPAVAEVCYSLVQSTGGAGSETTIRHAARRRGCVAFISSAQQPPVTMKLALGKRNVRQTRFITCLRGRTSSLLGKT
jgi:hypothetical protein